MCVPVSCADDGCCMITWNVEDATTLTCHSQSIPKGLYLSPEGVCVCVFVQREEGLDGREMNNRGRDWYRDGLGEKYRVDYEKHRGKDT